MSDENKKIDLPYQHNGHKKPKTRRDFIAQGFIGLSSSLVLPSFAGMVMRSNPVLAQERGCALPEFQGGLPYICIDGGGGMNIAGANAFVSMGRGTEVQDEIDYAGASTSDYIRIGISPEEHPSVSGKPLEGKYGLKFHRASGILQGMNQVLDGHTMPNGNPIADGVDGLIFCTRTSDDTATNPINTVFMANKAGAKGELVELIGNASSDTGARSAAPADQINLGLRPTRVNSGGTASGLLSLGPELSGTNYLNLSGNGGQERVQKFMDRLAKMSKTKLEDLSQKRSIAQIQSVLNCSLENAKQLFSTYSAAMLDPTNDTAVQRAFAQTAIAADPTNGINDTFASQGGNVASVAKLVIDKIAGAGTITIGGCDYHGNPIATTHEKDRQVGEAIGRCILLAKEKGENCAIHLYTDGGVASDAGGATQPQVIPGLGEINKVRHVGDSGTRSAALLIVYKHNHDGSSLVRENNDGEPRRQIGNFVKNGGVDLSTVIGDSTENLWKAIMLNYLAAQGKEGEFENIFGSGSLPPESDTLIRMKKITA